MGGTGAAPRPATRARLRRPRRRARRWTPPSCWPLAAPTSSSSPPSGCSALGRQHELPGVPARLRRARRDADPRRAGWSTYAREPAGALVAVLGSDYADPRSSDSSTTSSSSTARCPTTSSTSTWCPPRATSARSTTARCWPGARRRSCANAGGALRAVPRRRRRRQPQHPRRGRTTRCACARPSDHLADDHTRMTRPRHRYGNRPADRPAAPGTTAAEPAAARPRGARHARPHPAGRRSTPTPTCIRARRSRCSGSGTWLFVGTVGRDPRAR